MDYIVGKINELPNTRKVAGLCEAVEVFVNEINTLKDRISSLEATNSQLQKKISLLKEKETQDGRPKKSTRRNDS